MPGSFGSCLDLILIPHPSLSSCPGSSSSTTNALTLSRAIPLSLSLFLLHHLPLELCYATSSSRPTAMGKHEHRIRKSRFTADNTHGAADNFNALLKEPIVLSHAIAETTEEDRRRAMLNWEEYATQNCPPLSSIQPK